MSFECRLKSAARPQSPVAPDVMLQTAERQATKGLTEDARNLAVWLTQHFPDLLDGWLLLIRLEAVRGDTRKTFAAFLRQLKRHPDQKAALVALARAYRVLGYLSKPIRLLQPFLEVSSESCLKHRSQAITVLRDCMLASDSLEDLQKTVQSWSAETRTELSCDRSITGCPMDHLRALTTKDVVVDPSLSSLEALVLLRFSASPPCPAVQRTLLGPVHMKPLADLLQGFTFKELASQTGPGDQASLSSALAMPAPVLKQVRQTGAYFHADTRHVTRWQAALRDLPRPLVALAWNETRAGLMPDDYRHLLERLHGFGGTFLSVVRDNSRHQLTDLPRVVDCGRQFDSLTDLSAVLSQVDLLVGPDGLPTHVAGAMGRPTVLLTQPAHPWYWHANNGRSTWYPSVQVVRTKRFGHWSNLMTDVTETLALTIEALPASKAFQASY
ncbi:glycosyltransferase family 9 protein [Labrenzia sp. VG12]|uniref:glycosyltransferase family 9 protein n=1 Tax=Labrenzia sp. VG12 TaxID=2021862 RepID=UPI000B8BE0AE|nr:glycosyltransferase family 9 protein [Labrenzia sp. VG12]ASP32175.1 hypothetical protein CHH27_02070 [Labrenzia sp. VG12]